MVANDTFSQLSTEKFRVKMRASAIEIYQSIWPGCEIQDLREEGVKVHILDKEFGIDMLCNFPSGQWISVQEKYRAHKFYAENRYKSRPPTPDFTQEHKNGYGTPYESNGEWFKLAAQLYFYGWSNADESGFVDWCILDVAKYKMLVERQGGLGRIGTFKVNKFHGRASFFAIPITTLMPAIVWTPNILSIRNMQIEAAKFSRPSGK